VGWQRPSCRVVVVAGQRVEEEERTGSRRWSCTVAVVALLRGEAHALVPGCKCPPCKHRRRCRCSHAGIQFGIADPSCRGVRRRSSRAEDVTRRCRAQSSVHGSRRHRACRGAHPRPGRRQAGVQGSSSSQLTECEQAGLVAKILGAGVVVVQPGRVDAPFHERHWSTVHPLPSSQLDGSELARASSQESTVQHRVVAGNRLVHSSARCRHPSTVQSPVRAVLGGYRAASGRVAGIAGAAGSSRAHGQGVLADTEVEVAHVVGAGFLGALGEASAGLAGVARCSHCPVSSLQVSSVGQTSPSSQSTRVFGAHSLLARDLAFVQGARVRVLTVYQGVRTAGFGSQPSSCRGRSRRSSAGRLTQAPLVGFAGVGRARIPVIHPIGKLAHIPVADRRSRPCKGLRHPHHWRR